MNEITIKLSSYLTAGNIEDVVQEIKGALVSKSDIKIIFDFQQVQILDSEGLSLIINTCKKVQQTGNLDMVFQHMTPEVFSVLELTGLADKLKDQDKDQYISLL